MSCVFVDFQKTEDFYQTSFRTVNTNRSHSRVISGNFFERIFGQLCHPQLMGLFAFSWVQNQSATTRRPAISEAAGPSESSLSRGHGRYKPDTAGSVSRCGPAPGYSVLAVRPKTMAIVRNDTTLGQPQAQGLTFFETKVGIRFLVHDNTLADQGRKCSTLSKNLSSIRCIDRIEGAS